MSKFTTSSDDLFALNSILESKYSRCRANVLSLQGSHAQLTVSLSNLTTKAELIFLAVDSLSLRLSLKDVNWQIQKCKVGFVAKELASGDQIICGRIELIEEIKKAN